MEQTTESYSSRVVAPTENVLAYFCFASLRSTFLMILSCLIGILLIFNGNKLSSTSLLYSSLSYLFGSVFLLPSLYLFFTLYQALLRPHPVSVILEDNDLYGKAETA